MVYYVVVGAADAPRQPFQPLSSICTSREAAVQDFSTSQTDFWTTEAADSEDPELLQNVPDPELLTGLEEGWKFLQYDDSPVCVVEVHQDEIA